MHVELDGELDPVTGWAMDFGPVKAATKKVADTLDHRLIIPTAPGRVTHEIDGETVIMGSMDLTLHIPREDGVLIPIPTSTAEHLAGWVLEPVIAKVELGQRHALRVGVDEGYSQGAWAQWTRGRKVKVYGTNDSGAHKALVRNYLGIRQMKGTDFMAVAREQAKKLGAELNQGGRSRPAASDAGRLIRALEGRLLRQLLASSRVVHSRLKFFAPVV